MNVFEAYEQSKKSAKFLEIFLIFILFSTVIFLSSGILLGILLEGIKAIKEINVKRRRGSTMFLR